MSMQKVHTPCPPHWNWGPFFRSVLKNMCVKCCAKYGNKTLVPIGSGRNSFRTKKVFTMSSAGGSSFFPRMTHMQFYSECSFIRIYNRFFSKRLSITFIFTGSQENSMKNNYHIELSYTKKCMVNCRISFKNFNKCAYF